MFSCGKEIFEVLLLYLRFQKILPKTIDMGKCVTA